jgi:hypothetical protein
VSGINNISTICMNHYYLRGLCPGPHFILCLPRPTERRSGGETKNEARKIKPKRSPPRSAATQKFQAKRAKPPCRNFMRCSIIHTVNYFKGVHELLRKFTATAAPRFGGATARCIEPASPQRVRSKRTIPYSDGFPFKRRRSPLICTLMSAG